MTVYAWHDKWCLVCPLCDYIAPREIYDASLCNKSKVAEIVQDGHWYWPDEWLDKYPILGQCQVPILQTDVKDEVLWITRKGKERKFDIKTVWKDMCSIEQKVNWSSVVWFAQSISRHAFVLWLAVQKRLITQDRLLVWKLNDDLKCAMCNNYLIITYFSLVSILMEFWKELQMNYWDQVVEEITRMGVCTSIGDEDCVVLPRVFYLWEGTSFLRWPDLRSGLGAWCSSWDRIGLCRESVVCKLTWSLVAGPSLGKYKRMPSIYSNEFRGLTLEG
ncbi:RNA-directed DNA polymerase, eukaryota, reverse transcriptase zinc-binding domain protein [Tanacetum coccineum]